MFYGIDDWRHMNANAMINRALDRSRERAGVRTQVTRFPLADTVAALDALRAGEIEGAAVVVVD